MLYELINPSDPITFHAADDAVAACVAIAVGEGHFAAKRTGADGDAVDVGGFALFCDEAECERRIEGWLGTSLKEFLGARARDVADALDSLAPVRLEERATYDQLLADCVDPDGVRRIEADRRRSGDDDIAGRGWELAAFLRKTFAVEREGGA